MKMADEYTPGDYEKSIKNNSPLPILKNFRWERYFTRPLASLIVKAVFRTSITPNQLTYFSFVLGLGAAAAFCGGTPLFFIIGGILTQLGSIIDCADGQLARAKKLQSRYGTYLDLFLDRISDTITILGMNWGYYLYSGEKALFILGLVTSGLYNLQVVLYYMVKQYYGKDDLGDRAEARGFAVFLVLITSVFNRLNLMILAIFVMTILNIGYRMVIFLGKARQQPPS